MVLVALHKRPAPSMAMGIEKLTQEAGQAKLHETNFLHAVVSNRQGQSNTSHARRGRDASWISRYQLRQLVGFARPRGSAVHRNYGGVPACQEKRNSTENSLEAESKWCAPWKKQRLGRDEHGACVSHLRSDKRRTWPSVVSLLKDGGVGEVETTS